MSATGEAYRSKKQAQMEKPWKPTNRREPGFGDFFIGWLWMIAAVLAIVLLIFGAEKVLGCFRG